MDFTELDDAKKLYGHLVQELDKLDIGYVQLMRYLADFDQEKRGHEHDYAAHLRPLIKKARVFVNGGYQQDTAEEALANGQADAVVFGRPFIANPNLAELLVQGKASPAEIKWPDWTKLYGVHGPDGSLINPEEGYIY